MRREENTLRRRSPNRIALLTYELLIIMKQATVLLPAQLCHSLVRCRLCYQLNLPTLQSLPSAGSAGDSPPPCHGTQPPPLQSLRHARASKLRLIIHIMLSRAACYGSGSRTKLNTAMRQPCTLFFQCLTAY